MSEKKLQKYILNNIDYTGHWIFVESKQVSPGVPDLNFCIKGIEGNIELKWGTDKKPPTLRPTQCAWFRRRVRAKGNCWLFLGWGMSNGTNQFYLIEGKHVPQLIDAKTKEEWTKNALCSWNNFVRWDNFLRIILHHS